MTSGTQNAAMMIGAVVLGIATAALQGFGGNTMQFVGAASVPVLFGLLVTGVRKLFRRRPANMFKWMLGWAVVAFVIELLQRFSN